MAENRDELERRRDELERTLRKRLSEGDRDGAATAVIESYGPEIYSFLVAVHRSEPDADDCEEGQGKAGSRFQVY